MVIREEGEGCLAIGQPSHAWVSGQLARAWGNERFGVVSPWEEVCLGAEQHDVGMTDWDLEPELDPETGRPRSFMAMALETHLELWSRAPHRLRAQSRYAALLVSLHGAGLYERRDLDALEPDRARRIRAFLDDQRGVQERLLEELRADPVTASGADPETVARNRSLVWTWDTLSLALLLDWSPHETDEVPTAAEPVRLRLRGLSPRRVELDPWPFASDGVEVRCEGRRLERRYADEDEMRAGLAAAPWETLRFELLPAARA